MSIIKKILQRYYFRDTKWHIFKYLLKYKFRTIICINETLSMGTRILIASIINSKKSFYKLKSNFKLQLRKKLNSHIQKKKIIRENFQITKINY